MSNHLKNCELETNHEDYPACQENNMENSQEKFVIDELIEHVETECREVDQEEEFDKMLQSCYPETVNVCGVEMNSLRVFKEMDPLAYRVGASDYFGNGDEYYEINGSYYRKPDVEAARNEFVESLEEEGSELDDEYSEVVKSGYCPREIIELPEKIRILRDKIKEVKQYVF